MGTLPCRKPMKHTPPFRADGAFYFVTVCAAERGGCELADNAAAVLAAARHYHLSGKWFVALCLVMPDHIHMLVHVPPDRSVADTVTAWKHCLSNAHGLSFQRDFFDTRIRDDAHFAEKWNYIVRNPVAKGLAKTPREWPHSIAFDRTTGEERAHR